jgi:hypothetical protein
MSLFRPTFALPLSLLLTAAACASSPVGTPGVASPGAGTRTEILASDLGRRVSILADDSLAGRDTGSPGIDAAANYIASELTRLGLRPMGDRGTFFQSVPLQRKATRATVSGENVNGPFNLSSDEIIPVSGIMGLPEASRTTGSGPLIFGGHLVDEPLGANELSAAQLAGAIVIVRLSAPAGVNAEAQPPRMTMAMLFSQMSPAAAVLLVAEEAEKEQWQYAADVASKGAVRLGDAGGSGPTAPPFFFISIPTAERLLGAPLSNSRMPRTNLGTFSYTLEEEVRTIPARNVVGMLPGRDPARSNEVIALGGHYDHIGIGAPVDGDSIYNGADDNASGSAVLLEIAESLAGLPTSQRPARSVLFAWYTAEESGLLGSEYLTDNFPVSIGSVVANVNMDMVGRNSPDSIFSIGTRKVSSEFGDLVEAVNARMATPLIFDYEFDAPGHPEQLYCRSDHYNFARFGIPVLFLTSGLHPQYHQPSDEVALIDNEKLARIAKLLEGVTIEVGNRAGRFRVDQPVPPLGTPCSA